MDYYQIWRSSNIYDTLILPFKNTLFSLIPKENATVSICSVLDIVAFCFVFSNAIDSVSLGR
jgi:hypothetical protein